MFKYTRQNLKVLLLMLKKSVDSRKYQINTILKIHETIFISKMPCFCMVRISSMVYAIFIRKLWAEGNDMLPRLYK